MRVLVCGGRDFADREFLYRVLDDLHASIPITAIIEGDSRGADHMAGDWARSRRIPLKLYPAEWGVLGNSAGPKRNQMMLDMGHPDRVIAFPGGRGTADMVQRAIRKGVPVTSVTQESYYGKEELDKVSDQTPGG